MKKILIALIPTLFIANSGAVFSENIKNIFEAKNSQNLCLYTYPQKLNSLTEIKIAGDGSCGYGSLLLATYLEFLSKGHIDKADKLQDMAMHSINNNNNPARKYLLQQLSNALNSRDPHAQLVRFLVSSTVERVYGYENTTPDRYTVHLQKLENLPTIENSNDWLYFYKSCKDQDVYAELIEKALKKSNNLCNVQHVVDVLEDLDYLGFVKYRFELFDAIAYVLGVNFQIYDNNGAMIASRNFGFESQIQVKYIEGIHYNILLSDDTLSCLSKFGMGHKTAPWSMRAYAWFIKIYGQMISANSVEDYSIESNIIKTEDEKYFFNFEEKYRDPFWANLELGIGLSKIKQGHVIEGKKILRDTILGDSKKRLLEALTYHDSVIEGIETSKGDAANYLEDLYECKNLKKIGEIFSAFCNLTACFYDNNNNILYKTTADNSNCDLNIKFLDKDRCINLIPVDQIKFFRNNGVLQKKYCLLNVIDLFNLK